MIRSLLLRTIAYGWTSALQQATVQLGKLGIQAIVNTMGVSVAAAFAIVNRIDDFAYTPEQNIAHAMTALMAQNKGAGKKDRMREGFRCGMILEIIYGLIVFALCFLFAREFMLCFIKDEEVIGHRCYLPASDLPDVYTAGCHKRDPGVFPRYRQI